MLLDLHNLYANALNSGRDPAADLLRLPLDRVTAIHLSGGHWIPEPAIRSAGVCSTIMCMMCRKKCSPC